MISQLSTISHGYTVDYLESKATLPKLYHYHALLIEHLKATAPHR